MLPNPDIIIKCGYPGFKESAFGYFRQRAKLQLKESIHEMNAQE